MAYGLSNGHVTDDVTWPPKVLWRSTVDYPSDSLASCQNSYTTFELSCKMSDLESGEFDSYLTVILPVLLACVKNFRRKSMKSFAVLCRISDVPSSLLAMKAQKLHLSSPKIYRPYIIVRILPRFLSYFAPRQAGGRTGYYCTQTYRRHPIIPPLSMIINIVI